MRKIIINWKLIFFALLAVLVGCSIPIYNGDWKWKAYTGRCTFTPADAAAGKPLTQISDIAIDPNSNLFISFEPSEENQCWFFHTYILVKDPDFGEILPEVDDLVTWDITGYNYSVQSFNIENETRWVNYFKSDGFDITTEVVCTLDCNKYGTIDPIVDFIFGESCDTICEPSGNTLSQLDVNTYKKELGNTVRFSNIEALYAPVRGPIYEIWFKFQNYGGLAYFNLIFPEKLRDYMEVDSEGDFDGDGYRFSGGPGTDKKDCNDLDPSVKPDSKEICYDDKDNDCINGFDDYDGLHGNIPCDQEQNQYTCEGTDGYEFLPNKGFFLGSFLQGAGCCGNNVTDFGVVVRPTSGPKAGKNMLCYYDGTNEYWKDATEHGFEIEKSPSLYYDVISDSLNWFGCAQSGILPGGINTLTAYQILTYSGAAAAELFGIGQTSATYVGGTNDLALLPAEQWNSGLSIFTATGGGIPGYCNNKVLDADKGESDIDCGGSCNPCFDDKNCNVNEDCISGNCDETEKKCKPATVPVDLSQKSYMAKRFICSKRNTENIFTECAGFNLGTAKNINLRDKIRRAGNLLSSIFEFIAAADNVNYAIVYGLPIEIGVLHYMIPFYVERDADNKITDWTNYDALEFDIAYAKDITPYLNVAIFNNYIEPWKKEFKYSLSLNSATKVFDQPIKNFIVNQPQEGRWVHVRIPINNINRNKITFIALYAAQEVVPKDTIIIHPNLSRQYRNVIAIDRIALTKENTILNKYCAAFPTGSVDGYLGDYWINGSDLDNTNILDVMSFPVGKIICDQTPSWGWTGTKCCGNNMAENYVDTKAGCLRGSIVRNNSVFNFTENADGTGAITSVLFMDGKFNVCGGTKSGFPPTGIAANDVGTTANDNCNSLGAWYCDFDSFWKDKYKIAGQIINTTYTLPKEVIGGAPETAGKGCCPSNYCWSGPEFIVGVNASETGSKGCVPDQSAAFALGDEFLFNSSLNYGKYDDKNITGNNVAYRCIKGIWNIAIPKWNQDHTQQGYCERFDQCFLNETTGCVDAGYWKEDKYCENKTQTITIGSVTLPDINFANWTTRTKLVAYELFKIANSSPESRSNFTIYCDSYDKVLNEYQYYQDYFAGKSSEELILGDKTTVQTIGGAIERFKCPNQGPNGTLPCTNNWCALRYEKDGGEGIIIGTSLNLEPDTRKYIANSILKLFPESSRPTTGADHYDFCDKAINDSNATGNFYGCLGRESSAAPTQNANLWFNNRTQVLLYSVEPFTIRTEAPTFFENFFRNPILTIIQLFTGNPLSSAFDFVRDLSDFNKIYVSVLGSVNSKKIMGTIERVGANQTMIVNYENLGINITAEPFYSQLDCGNPFEVNICTYNSTTDTAAYATKSINKFNIFDELTTRTRLE